MKFYKFLFLLLFSTLSCLGSSADDSNVKSTTIKSNKQGTVVSGGARSPMKQIKAYLHDNQMWFDMPGGIDYMNVTVWNIPNGAYIEEQVCDNTPFDVPFTEGTLIITCTNDEGLYGEGTIEL